MPCELIARVRWALITVVCAGSIVAAARLTPDPSGVGTHTRFGLAPCGVPRDWGIPCPTCGVTTAFVHAARGQFLLALRVQPVGLLVALALALLGAAGLGTVVTGRRWVVNWARVPPVRLVVAMVAVVVLAWVYKIATFRI